MIYQYSDEYGTVFKLHLFKATYEGQEIYGDTIKEVEEYIKEIYDFSFVEDGQEKPPFVMPSIESCFLTEEQNTRFIEYSKIIDITLDDVVNYVFYKKAGVSSGYKNYVQQNEIILHGQMITDLEISEIQNGQSMTDFELLLIGGTV